MSLHDLLASACAVFLLNDVSNERAPTVGTAEAERTEMDRRSIDEQQ